MSDKFIKYDGYLGSIEFCLENSVLHGKLLFIDDVITYEADNLTNLQNEFEAAVIDYKDMCQTLNREPCTPYKGSFNIRIGSELHKSASIKAKIKGVSLNDYVKSVIQEDTSRNGVTKKVHHLHVHTIKASQLRGSFVSDYNSSSSEETEWDMPKKLAPELKLAYSSNQHH